MHEKFFNTQKISFVQKENKSRHSDIISEVNQALLEKGYDPVVQLSGYILSSDPTYITNHKNARSLISKIDRDELLEDFISFYLEKTLWN